MARKQKVNKTEAVREYLKAHRGAKSSEIVEALRKKGIELTAAHAANIKSKVTKVRRGSKTRAAKPIVEGEPAPAAAAPENPAKAGTTITIEQVKAVAQAVKAVGGLARLDALLGLIKEVGGVKKFRDFAEAMSAVSETGPIPF
jgi:hypothetical protein